MSDTKSDVDIEFIEKSDESVVLLEDEAYRLSSEDIQIHEANNGTVFIITSEDYYTGNFSDDGWFVPNEDLPDWVAEDIFSGEDLRVAKEDLEGTPVQLTVGYSGDHQVYRSGWQREVIRPDSELSENLPNIQSVRLVMDVRSDGSVVITDVQTHTSSSHKVTFDL
jgi:hypothetical protein